MFTAPKESIASFTASLSQVLRSCDHALPFVSQLSTMIGTFCAVLLPGVACTPTLPNYP